ncbi:MAG: glucose-6-phosphate isomerase family protein, partial [Candidatus Paceibacterales bacterium]
SEGYGELYIVLKGEGIFLVQKQKENKIEDVYATKAKKGSFVIVPPHYGHETINPSKKTLKIANWVSKRCKNSYKLFEKMQGACYYYTKSGWLKNKSYRKTPKLYFKKPLKTMPKNLDFLK